MRLEAVALQGAAQEIPSGDGDGAIREWSDLGKTKEKLSKKLGTLSGREAVALS